MFIQPIWRYCFTLLFSGIRFSAHCLPMFCCLLIVLWFVASLMMVYFTTVLIYRQPRYILYLPQLLTANWVVQINFPFWRVLLCVVPCAVPSCQSVLSSMWVSAKRFNGMSFCLGLWRVSRSWGPILAHSWSTNWWLNAWRGSTWIIAVRVRCPYPYIMVLSAHAADEETIWNNFGRRVVFELLLKINFLTKKFLLKSQRVEQLHMNFLRWRYG